MEELNLEQKNAVCFNKQYAMVLAGAGTGKTRTIIYRAIHLINQGVSPNKIVILTFTRRAANEIITRLHSKLKISTQTVFAGTFHSFCILNIRKYNQFFNLSNYKIIDAEDQKQLIKYAIETANITTSKKAAEIVKLISYARNSNISISNYLKKINFIDTVASEISDIFAEYQRQKKKMEYLDFDDILIIFSQLLQKNQQLKNSIVSNYSNFLVDEMQDTNPIQWSILETLSSSCNLFCVGDDAQSIYMFRGADFKNVQNFTNKLFSAEKLQLKENFRSNSNNEFLDKEASRDENNYFLENIPKELIDHHCHFNGY